MNEVNFKVGDVVLLGEPFQDSTIEFVILKIKEDGAVLVPRHFGNLKALPLLPPVPVQFLKLKTDDADNSPIGFAGFRQGSRR